jgi:LPS export ABC transporter protein LptC
MLVGAAVLTSVLVYLAPSSEETPPPAARLGLGYYVKDATLTGTGEDGQILYRVTASAAEETLRDGTVTMQDVNVDYEPAGEIPWKLKADRGQIPPDRNIIQLSGEVVATTGVAADKETAPPKGRTGTAPLLIRTDYLELDPETYIARTERMVAVERSGDTLRARGMRVYLKQDRLQFESEVRGRFLP